MLNVVLNGKDVEVEDLTISYTNGVLDVNIKTQDGVQVKSASGLSLNYSNREVFLISLLDSFQAPANMCGYGYLKRIQK